MTTVTLTTTGSGTWSVPVDCPAGTAIAVELWGGGQGGGSGTGVLGGNGGSWGNFSYSVTASDVSGGVSYNIGATGAANLGAGGDSTWAATKNLLRNTTLYGAVVGTIGSGGSLPTGWSSANGGGLTVSVVALGTDATTGLRYIDIRWQGTTATNTNAYLIFDSAAPMSASLSYTYSLYSSLAAGSKVPFTAIAGHIDFETSAAAYISTGCDITASSTGTLTRASATATSAATTALGFVYFKLDYALAATVDATFRFMAPQLEQAASVTAFAHTYRVLGGVTSTTKQNQNLSSNFAGGAGAGTDGGGGGSAGKDGVGLAGTATGGAGGAGDNGSGGAGGAATAGTGTSNVEGGGGGGGRNATGTGGVAGAPGGGGGAARTTGGIGGRGQIRITYTPGFDVSTQWHLPSIQIWDH